MRTIIACTDFSPVAANAVQYAAALASATNAPLLLYHHFKYPIPATDMTGLYPAKLIDEVTENLETSLSEIKDNLSKSYQIEIGFVVRSLDMQADLEDVFQSEDAGLVVMGLQGSNWVSHLLFGSETARAIRRGKLPLLLIPKGSAFQPPKKILFPFDDQEIPNPGIVQPLLDLADYFDAHIEVLTLFDLEKTPELAPQRIMPASKGNLDALLVGTSHEFAYLYEDNIKNGILSEAAQGSADIVAMISHHHSFLSMLLHQSETQRVASSIQIPLLVLGEG